MSPGPTFMHGAGITASLRLVGPVQTKYMGWLDYADVAALVLARSVSHQHKAGVLATLTSALSPDPEHRCTRRPV